MPGPGSTPDDVRAQLRQDVWACAVCYAKFATAAALVAHVEIEYPEEHHEDLRTSRGVTAGRMTARGYGETQPVFPNDSEGRAWQNRREPARTGTSRSPSTPGEAQSAN